MACIFGSFRNDNSSVHDERPADTSNNGAIRKAIVISKAVIEYDI